MPHRDERSPGATERRRKADQTARDRAGQSKEDVTALSPEQARQTLQELRARQVELKTRNEELRRAQTELDAVRQSEEWLRGILDTVHNVYLRADVNGRVVRVSPSAAQLYGYDVIDDMIGLPAESLYAAAADRQAMLVQLRPTGRVADYVIQCRKKDRSTFWASLNVQIFRDEQGNVVGTEGFVRDITDRKRAEEELRESEERSRIFFEHAADVVLLLEIRPDDVPVIRDVSSATCRLLGYERDELIGRPVSCLDAAFDSPTIVEERRRKFCLGETFETKHRCKDGGIRIFECWATEVQGGSKALAVSVERDITDRKRAEEQLRDLTGRLELATASAKAGVWDWNVRTNEMIWDDRMLELYGLTRENFPGGVEAWEHGLHPDDAPRAIDECQAALRGEREFDTQFSVRRPDGTRVQIKANGLVLRDEQGTALRMIGLNTDITERKRAEEALRESEERFRKVFEEGPLGMVMTSVSDGRFTRANAAFCEMVGYEEEELTRLTFADVTDPDDRSRDVEAVQRLWAGQIPHYRTEKRYLRKNGETFEGLVVASLIRNSEGKPLYSLAMIDDITERKRAEDALRQEQQFSHSVLASLPGIFYLYSYPEHRLVRWNKQHETLLGYETAEMNGRLVTDWHVPEARDAVLRAIEGVMETGRGSIEAPLVAKDGHLVPFLLTGARLEVQGRRFLMGIGVDITERKRAAEERETLRAQLNQAQRMESIGRLAGGVAHDFNNMLGVILGHAEMALEQVDPAQPLHDDLTEIRTAASRSADLTRQLLAFARRQTVAPIVLDLNQTVGTTLGMLRRLIGEDIDLAWRPGKDPWRIEVDPSQIDQILANLCVNARDAIAGVGKVTIETENASFDDAYCASHVGYLPGDYVRLAVSDDGCGIDQETLSHLFEPFFTTKALGKGTGLGLATVYGIVKQNHGFINVYSEPGIGTTFRIYLPRHGVEAGHSRPARPAEPASGGHETILVVEDDPAVLKMTTRMLARLGYTVLAAHSPVEAIRVAGESGAEIHLLMTDVVMPEMNGRDLAATLLSLHPHLKRLFTSGYTANVIAHHGVLDQGVHFLQKPFSASDLAAKVREVLNQS
jgi:PAS domain S-box-containing protein